MGRVGVWLPAFLLLALLPAASATPHMELSTHEVVVPGEVQITVTNATGQWLLAVEASGEDRTLATGDVTPQSVSYMVQAAGRHVVRLSDDNGSVEAVIDATAPLQAGQEDEASGLGRYVAPGVWPIWIAAILMLALATYLLVKDRQRPINVAFAALFIARGLADLGNGLLFNTGIVRLPLDLMFRIHPVLNVAVVAAGVYFLLTYLAQNNAAWTKRPVALPIVLVAILLAAVAAARPALYWGDGGGGRGILFALTGLYYPLYTTAVWLLVRTSRRDLPDDRRDGLFYSALGFAFLPVYVGIGELVYVDLLRAVDPWQQGIGFAIGHYAAVLALLPVGLALWELVAQTSRDAGRHHARLHLALFGAAVLLPILSLAASLALYDPAIPISQQPAPIQLFEAFMGIWAIPYPVLVAVGIIRYQSSSQQRHMGKQLRRFALASLFFTVFFAVSEGTEALLSARWGTAAGLGSAALLTIVLRPVQNVVERRIGSSKDPAEETAQEVRFYREQVRRTLADGIIGEAERKFLLNLQDTMGITQDTARQVETDLMAEMGVMGTSRQAAA